MSIKNKRKYKRNMSTVGGKVIGEGSYGCIFDPPLLCKGNTYIKSSSELGKITRNDDAITELQIAAILRDRPLSSNYFILPEALTCQIESLDKQTDPDINKCEALQKFPIESMLQFKLKYGGVALHKYLNTLEAINQFNFIDFCVHLLEGASLLALAGVVHFDIFEPNIVIDKSGVPRYIDWGFGFKGAESTTELIDNNTPGWKTMNNRQSNTEPPEITLANAINHEKTKNDGINYILKGKPIIKELVTYYKISLEEQKTQLENFMEMSNSFKEKNWGTMFQTHWTKFDSWSIGCLISGIFLRLLQSNDFYETTYKQNKDRINKMLKGMLQLNPFKRIDCLEALEILEPHNKILERFGKEWLNKRKSSTMSK